jgi:secondary thiamine-phosphate synthase enzyme
MQELVFSTSRRIEALDLTDRLAGFELADGFAWLAIPHTTGALVLCESDAELLRDIERVAGEILAPFEPFEHRKNDNPNAAAHLLSALFGSQVVVPVTEGRLDLGTYQRVVFVELDGPRERRLRVAPIGGAVAARSATGA